MEKMLTVKEVSALLAVHPSTVYRMLKRGTIPAIQIGSDYRFDVNNIEKWVAAKHKEFTNGD